MKKVYVILAVVLLASVASQAAISSLVETGTNVEAGIRIAPNFGEGSYISGGSAPGSYDRMHTVKRAAQGNLSYPSNLKNATFPGDGGTFWANYLTGGEQIQIRWNNRSVTDYNLEITTDVISYVYVLMDNRVSGLGTVAADSEYDDPDIQQYTAWLADWTRMETGICPMSGNTKDWLGIDELDDNTVNNFYAVYRKVALPNTPINVGPMGQGANIFTVVVQPQCDYILAGDLNRDCRVNLRDLAVIAANWLVNCWDEPGNPACVLK